ncbi:MAG TPA: hypothetical protein VF647_01310 [Longimicrobium sp.]|jgi:hypothetical protein
MSKSMEGSEEQKQKLAREAKKEGKSASEVGASTGASKQQARADKDDSHQKRLDQKHEGKPDDVSHTQNEEARPGSRDNDTVDKERHPRL